MKAQSNVSDILQLMPSCVCAIIFIFFILLDVWKACQRRAHWIPGKALALSAFTLQLLAFINYSTINFFDSNQRKQEEAVSLKQNQLVIDSARAVFCVLIGYLLPGMVHCRWSNVWGDIGAFCLSLLANMASELYFIWNVRKKVNKNAELEDNPMESFWLIVSSTTISVTIILMSPVLGCSVLAGKSIGAMNSTKIPLALSCCSNSSEDCSNSSQDQDRCENIEYHVLKCWTVVRVSQPEYIMARSVFSSFAGLVITVCNVILALKWKYIRVQSEYHIVHRIMVLVHVAFILTGWTVVFFRWITAVMYFPIQNPLSYMEDFWTRRLVEVTDELDGHLAGRLFWETMNRQRSLLEIITANAITALRIHSIILNIMIEVQKIVVSVSKGCWCLSYIVFKISWWCISKIVIRIIPLFRMQSFGERKNMLFNSSDRDQKKFCEEALDVFKYKKALKIVRMPGEKWRSLWIANQWAFKKTVKHMIEGSKVVEFGCEELKTLIKETNQSVKVQVSELLDENKPVQIWLEDEVEMYTIEKQHFKFCTKKSWKMIAVSLIHLMIDSYINSSNGTKLDEVNGSIRAYWQAWDIMAMVDTSDPESKIVSMAADKELDALEKIWKKHLGMKYMEDPDHGKKVSSKLLEQLKEDLRKIKSQKLLERLKAQIDVEANTIPKSPAMDNHPDSQDWMEMASKISLSRTWTIIHDKHIQTTCELRPVLAKFIVHCIEEEADKALKKNCNKWAEDSIEQEIYEAAFVAKKTASIIKIIKKDKPETQGSVD